MKPSVTVVVEKVQLAGCNFLPKVAEEVFSSSAIRIKCLTHADTITDAALQQQIRLTEEIDERRRYPNQRPAAIFALNLKMATHGRHLSQLRDAFFGASKVTESSRILVCGLPNSGKSSLILPLTKARTMLVKKKKSYHLPNVSSTAGRTLGIKKHVLTDPDKKPLTLFDSPGLRSGLKHADPRVVAFLLATNVTEPFTGYKQIASHEMILSLLLKAANRHAAISREQPVYMELLGLNSPIDDPAVFLRTYKATVQNSAVDDLAVIRKFQRSEFGGLIFTPYRDQQYANNSSIFTFNRTSAVLYMNEEAKRLVGIGNGTATDDFVCIPRATAASRPVTSNQQLLLPVVDEKAGPFKPGEPVMFPPYRRGFSCMICAGFVKRDAKNKVFGKRQSRVQAWNHMDTLCYFSRMAEAFGSLWSVHTRYLFRDSLACTLAVRHKLRSRAAVYKKFKGLKEYPVPNHLRPKRFQTDQPVPWMHRCTGTKNRCVDYTDDMKQKAADRMEKLNITDHTWSLLRKRGQFTGPKPKKRQSKQQKERALRRCKNADD
jgi:hypothetical protein